MARTAGYRSTLVLAASIGAAALMSACTAGVRVEGPGHHWDAHEDAAYHRYLADQHLEYRDFNRLDANEQHSYWEWRDHHPD